jgi:hypothetical protein
MTTHAHARNASRTGARLRVLGIRLKPTRILAAVERLAFQLVARFTAHRAVLAESDSIVAVAGKSMRRKRSQSAKAEAGI